MRRTQFLLAVPALLIGTPAFAGENRVPAPVDLTAAKSAGCKIVWTKVPAGKVPQSEPQVYCSHEQLAQLRQPQKIARD